MRTSGRWESRRPLRLLPYVGLLLIGACVVEFRHPLPPPDPFRPDPRLLGAWNPIEGLDERIQFEARDSGWMDVVYLSRIGDAEGLDVETFEAYSTNIGKERFLCLRPRPVRRASLQTRTDAGDYLLAHYRIRGKRMSLTLFSRPKLEAMVRAGVLDGTVNDDADVVSVTVLAPSEQLAAIIAEKGVDAFIDDDDTAELIRSTHGR